MGIKMNALWIWYIGKNDIDSLIKVCDKYNIDTLLIHYNCYYMKHVIEDKYPHRFQFELLIGDTNINHTAETIKPIAKKYPHEIIHLNIEHYSRTQGISEFNKRLEDIFRVLEGRIITFDVQTWNHSKKYKQLMKMCYKVYLMAYSNTLIGTLFKVLQWFNYNLVVGLELNPEYKRAYLHNSENNIPIIDVVCSWLPMYNGLAIHHFGILK